jgi:superfamily II DNA or RNA helicase
LPGSGIPAAIADWAHPAGPGGARYEAAAAVLTTGGANPLLPHLERDLAAASGLAAFDTAREAFRRILFVAHREEILSEAVATFRRIRPTAAFGLYHGGEKSPEADILFASVQTLSRRAHLERFAPDAFDYIVVDEFHHADADTYRRVIDHFEPAFLLGLTATPERADGGNLLALCGENLAYRCAVPRGIELGLLCPFDYYGVPDDVDYTNIPWRSSRFDEKKLTAAVATHKRATNILDQWRKRGGERTIAFCVSQRHADFMRQWFRHHEVPCAAVHAGATSDQRSLSLEQLATVHLFVRSAKKRGANSAPFVYCGPVSFVDWQGDSPITVRWKLESALPERLVRELT